MTSTRFSSSITPSLARTATVCRSVFLPSLLCIVSVGALALVTGACGASQKTDEPATAAAESGAASETETEAAPADGSAGFEPITSRAEGGVGEEGSLPEDIEPAAGEAIQAPGLAFHLPADWHAETPTSSMRMAQASIPGEAGDGQLTVFYFGPGGGGGVDANIDRWVGQVELDPGKLPRRIRMDLAGGLVAHWVEVEGTLQPSMMGTGPTEAQANSRLQGAVIEGPQGPWFFKATGPSATLDTQRDAFFAMLRSLQPSI